MIIAVYNSVPIIYKSGQQVALQADQKGNLRTVNAESIPTGANYESNTTGASDLTDTTPFQMFAAMGAGTHHYITSVLVTNSGAVDTVVSILDGATVIFSANAKAGQGFAWNPEPYFYQATANTAINVVCRTASAAIQANAIGYWM